MNLFHELENFIIISINKTHLLICNLKQQIFTVNTKKQPPGIFTGKYLCLSLVLIKLRPSGLQLCEKEIPTQVFFCGYCEILKTLLFKKICERLLMNNVKRNYSSMKTVK